MLLFFPYHPIRLRISDFGLRISEYPRLASNPPSAIHNSKPQPCFSSGFGQAANAAVINVAASIENHLLDSLLFCAVRNQLADLFGGGDVPASSSPPGCFGRRSRHERHTLTVV